MTIHRPELTVLVGPFVPDGYVIIVEVLNVRVAIQKPKQLVDDGPKVKFFLSSPVESLYPDQIAFVFQTPTMFLYRYDPSWLLHFAGCRSSNLGIAS